MAEIRIQGITVAYNHRHRHRPVLEDFSLDIRSGELAAVIGPNGSGKTTLLRTLAGILRPLKGAVYVGGEEVMRLHEAQLARLMGVVAQEEPKLFDFTVFEVVLMGRTPHLSALRRLSALDLQSVEAAMRATGVWELRERLFSQLSGGECKRVVIARALAQEPQVLLLDEPTNGLDIRYQIEVVELIQRLNGERGMTAIVVIHDLNLAAMMADKFILLDGQGRIHAMGSAEQVITQKNIQQVYGAPVIVARHPITGKLTVTLRERRIFASPDLKVHVVCGGGTGREVLSLLSHLGCKVSAGALNRGDTDWEAARALGLRTIEEQPFSPISPSAYEETCSCIAEADVVVLTDVPFGAGNLLNLKAISQAARDRVVVISPHTLPQRDFTLGQAQSIMEEIYATKQLLKVNSIGELEKILGKVSQMPALPT